MGYLAGLIHLIDKRIILPCTLKPCQHAYRIKINKSLDIKDTPEALRNYLLKRYGHEVLVKGFLIITHGRYSECAYAVECGFDHQVKITLIAFKIKLQLPAFKESDDKLLLHHGPARLIVL